MIILLNKKNKIIFFAIIAAVVLVFIFLSFDFLTNKSNIIAKKTTIAAEEEVYPISKKSDLKHLFYADGDQAIAFYDKSNKSSDVIEIIGSGWEYDNFVSDEENERVYFIVKNYSEGMFHISYYGLDDVGEYSLTEIIFLDPEGVFIEIPELVNVKESILFFQAMDLTYSLDLSKGTDAVPVLCILDKYENKQFGFSLQLPEGWTSVEQPVFLDGGMVYNGRNIEFVSLDANERITLMIVDNELFYSAEDYGLSEIENNKMMFSRGEIPYLWQFAEAKLINLISADAFLIKDLADPGGNQDMVYIANQSFIYCFFYSYTDNEGVDIVDEQFRNKALEILNSLKFV